MTRLPLTVLLVFAAVLAGCRQASPVIVIEAQTLPVQLRAVFNTPPASDNVVSGKIVMDGTVLVDRAPVICPSTDNPAKCQINLAVGTFGAHRFDVSLQNLLVSTEPTSVQDGAATTYNTAINHAPGAVVNGTITKQ